MTQNDCGPGKGPGAADESSLRIDSIGLADIIQLAWESGRDYQPEGLAELYDDAVCSSIAPRTPQFSFEERIEYRMAEMEVYAIASETTWRGQYPGGPVDWETGQVLP